MNNKVVKVNAAIVIIGNEILSGRTQDVNISIISKWLNTLGVRVLEARVIPDVEERIIETINELKRNFIKFGLSLQQITFITFEFKVQIVEKF